MSKITSPSKGGVFVQGDFANRQTKDIFMRRGYHISPSIDAADVVVWTGGEDIDPKLYGETVAGSYGFDAARDKDDLEAVIKAHGLKKFLVGICRGAQLLNVIPNRGALWQDVNMHGSGVHVVQDFVTKKFVTVNSIHHQMMRVPKWGQIVAGCILSDRRRSAEGLDTGTQMDPEVVWYPDTRSLLFQGHPEFGHQITTYYFFELMERYYEGKVPVAGELEAPKEINSHGTVCRSGIGEQDDTIAPESVADLIREATAECGYVPGCEA